ncbi:hypothetical protein [Pararobbsia alpina]|uniref:hypothetical protein n=1 Tax=Pararobbsia alpina TaxID=621374 RepID=UPI001FE56533|nr:hypothetical protein [Pararobbsia alpina]
MRKLLLSIAQCLRQFRGVVDVDFEAEELHHARVGRFAAMWLASGIHFEPG